MVMEASSASWTLLAVERAWTALVEATDAGAWDWIWVEEEDSFWTAFDLALERTPVAVLTKEYIIKNNFLL